MKNLVRTLAIAAGTSLCLGVAAQAASVTVDIGGAHPRVIEHSRYDRHHHHHRHHRRHCMTKKVVVHHHGKRIVKETTVCR